MENSNVSSSLKDIKVSFLITKDLQKKLFAEGKNASAAQTISLNNKELVKYAEIDHSGNAFLTDFNYYEYAVSDKHDVYDENKISKYKAYIFRSEKRYYFNEIPTAEILIEFFAKTAPDMTNELQEKQKELDEKYEKAVVEFLKRKKMREENEEKENCLFAKKEAEKLEWIIKNGSEWLNLMIKEGYEFDKTYQTERLDFEFAKYGNYKHFRCDVEIVTNPSLSALKKLIELKDFTCKIVNLDGGIEYLQIDVDWCNEYVYIKI